MKNKIWLILTLTTFMACLSVGAAAQSVAGTVKTTAVRFAAGKNQATISGAASYAASYVYNFKVKKGQTITVKTGSKEPALTFSLFSPKPKEDELAFNAKDWTGTAPDAGVYSITLVMNNEKAKKVPYNLTIKVQ